MQSAVFLYKSTVLSGAKKRMNMLLQYYGVRYLLERKMPWEIESRLWEIAGEKRDVEDIIFIYQRDAETMAECVRRYEARYVCFEQEFTKLSQ